MKTPPAYLLCPVILSASACSGPIAQDAPPPEADATRLIQYEASVKADIARRLATDPDWAPLSVAVFDLTVGGLPVSPYALTAADDGVYVVDSDRRLVARWDETSQSTSIVIAIKDDESLEVPFDVQNRDDMLYVMDTTSLHVLGSDRKTVGHTRFFQSVYGFLSVGQNRFVLNVLDPTGGPELLLVDEQFVPSRYLRGSSWSKLGPARRLWTSAPGVVSRWHRRRLSTSAPTS